MDNSRGLNSSEPCQEISGKYGVVHKGRYEDWFYNRSRRKKEGVHPVKKRILILSAVLLAAVLAVLFAFLLLYGPSFGIYLRKPSPQDYGERALAFMENGYYSSTEEWRQAKAGAQDALRTAQSYEDTWPILRDALSAAGGAHSRLITRAEEEKAGENPITLPLVSTDSMEHGIVTLVIPEFTQGEERAQEYAQIVLSWLREHHDATGVILDLRSNRGGDLAPMICALSPLLPDGPLLGVRYANGQMNTMTLADGAFTGGSGMKVESFKMPDTIPIAILTGEWTASSGEAVLLAFRGLENVRSFGSPTAGYPSTNTVFRLYDGTQIVLTIGADVVLRTGEVFCEEPIPPDVLTDSPEQEAAAWIRSRFSS